jgi:hypothetical protein
VNVDPGVYTGQAFLGTGQLDPGYDLLVGGVALELGSRRVAGGLAGEVFDAGLERGECRAERIEPLVLDACFGADGERPSFGGQLPYRLSIGT